MCLKIFIVKYGEQKRIKIFRKAKTHKTTLLRVVTCVDTMLTGWSCRVTLWSQVWIPDMSPAHCLWLGEADCLEGAFNTHSWMLTSAQGPSGKAPPPQLIFGFPFRVCLIDPVTRFSLLVWFLVSLLSLSPFLYLFLCSSHTCTKQ